MFNKEAAYELFDVLVDMLEEYEFEVECLKKTGEDTAAQHDIIQRAKNAIEFTYPGYLEKRNAENV
jgi:hypothetical protein